MDVITIGEVEVLFSESRHAIPCIPGYGNLHARIDLFDGHEAEVIVGGVGDKH